MHSPPYPSAIYSYTLHGNLQCAGQQWAGRRTNGFTSIYESVYTGSMKRRVIAITQMGIWSRMFQPDLVCT